MSFGFASIEHALASIANDIVKGAKLLTGVATKVQGSETAVEAVSAMIEVRKLLLQAMDFCEDGLPASARNLIDRAVGARP